MTPCLARRELLLTLAAAVATACAHPTSGPEIAPNSGADGELVAIEASVGGRLGVFALDTGSGRTLAHRADERFAMCSTFKWVLAAAAFARVDRGEGTLEERIPFGAADLMEVAPVAREH